MYLEKVKQREEIIQSSTKEISKITKQKEELKKDNEAILLNC